jgi:hypothetical protein
MLLEIHQMYINLHQYNRLPQYLVVEVVLTSLHFQLQRHHIYMREEDIHSIKFRGRQNKTKQNKTKQTYVSTA